MPFANYTQLITAIQGVADSSDDMLDELRLAEVQAQLDIRLRFPEATAFVATTPGQDFIDLPTSCVSVRHLRFDTTPVSGVDVVASETFDYLRNGQGNPRGALMQGLKLYLAPTPQVVLTGTLFFTQGIAPLDGGNPTNWLLENCPNVLLYGALIQWGLGKQGGDERVGGWQALYASAAKLLRAREANTRMGGGPVRMRPDTWA